ncbi:MAG TPA: alpha-D-ribose 1-methylphosphonate 5-triphosphate diphosphatase [Nitrolancea sp.]|jgi:alpha-D-ribose 1-methylphosphonate 5-triphosphate diphosphatase|nr:alpha-D-ribose 1-methylphosphonate 5-triphosphate diphosphatase [Nitrolancea sp.]
MVNSLLIKEARAVLPDRVLESASVRVAQGTIVEVSATSLTAQPGEAVIEAGGRFLIPGLIDLHCDNIEKELQPRPGVMVPMELALAELDRKLALAGITTMYHSISFGAGEGVRSNEVAAQLARAIAHFATECTLVNHRVHIRFELSNYEALDLTAELLEEGTANLLSFMDHTPGQGQYRNPERFREYVRKTYHLGEDAVESIVQMKLDGRARVTDAQVRELAALALRRGIPLAAHDLDTRNAVTEAVARRITLVEFPMSLDVAQFATDHGLHNCVGAPNVVLGRSQDGNLSAREVIAAGAADVLCSDYHPGSVLRAIFMLADLGLVSLCDAVALATRNPATAVGLGDTTGVIQVGAAGDLLLVSEDDGRVAVDSTIVAGEVVLTATPRVLVH